MVSRLFALLIFVFSLAVAGVAAAQDTRAIGAGPARASDPPDMRIGAFRPVPGQDGTMAGQAGLAVPLLAVAKDYRIGPNDLLDIEVLDMDSVKRTVRVNAAGAISLPLVGAVTVAGLTSQEVEARIAERYKEKYLQNPQISVFIKEFTTERITVEGAVAKPGIFPLTGQMTLLRALALAGGFGPIANSSEVMLFRNNEARAREVSVYDVDKIRSGQNEDPLIKGDDLIVVQRDSTRRVLRDSLLRDIIDSINPFTVFTRP
jgi:polysaccharide export outer membrane protein